MLRWLTLQAFHKCLMVCFNPFLFLELYQICIYGKGERERDSTRAICFIHRSRSSFDNPSGCPRERYRCTSRLHVWFVEWKAWWKMKGNKRLCVCVCRARKFLLAAGRCCGGDRCPGNVRMFLFIWKWLELFHVSTWFGRGIFYVVSSFSHQEGEKTLFTSCMIVR